MLTNERVQALIATDRDTLIDLMAIAVSAGSWGGSGDWNIYLDPDIKALLEAARARNALPMRPTPSKDWINFRDQS